MTSKKATTEILSEAQNDELKQTTAITRTTTNTEILAAPE
jgi:hypothetical protein